MFAVSLRFLGRPVVRHDGLFNDIDRSVVAVLSVRGSAAQQQAEYRDQAKNPLIIHGFSPPSAHKTRKAGSFFLLPSGFFIYFFTAAPAGSSR